MVYHLMYIHGIYVVYRGISMDIPSFLKPDFAAGPCCWFNAHTRVGDQEYFIPRATMAIAPGEKAVYKRLNPTAADVHCLQLVAAVTAAAAAASRVAFRFPRLVAGNDLKLGE